MKTGPVDFPGQGKRTLPLSLPMPRGAGRGVPGPLVPWPGVGATLSRPGCRTLGIAANIPPTFARTEAARPESNR